MLYLPAIKSYISLLLNFISLSAIKFYISLLNYYETFFRINILRHLVFERRILFLLLPLPVLSIKLTFQKTMLNRSSFAIPEELQTEALGQLLFNITEEIKKYSAVNDVPLNKLGRYVAGITCPELLTSSITRRTKKKKMSTWNAFAAIKKAQKSSWNKYENIV